jgi:hypothetical protein
VSAIKQVGYPAAFLSGNQRRTDFRFVGERGWRCRKKARVRSVAFVVKGS